MSSNALPTFGKRQHWPTFTKREQTISTNNTLLFISSKHHRFSINLNFMRWFCFYFGINSDVNRLDRTFGVKVADTSRKMREVLEINLDDHRTVFNPNQRQFIEDEKRYKEKIKQLQAGRMSLIDSERTLRFSSLQKMHHRRICTFARRRPKWISTCWTSMIRFTKRPRAC